MELLAYCCIQQQKMNCNCRSKDLYKNATNQTFCIDGKIMNKGRKITEQIISVQNKQLLNSIYQNSQIYLPTKIDKICAQQLYLNPVWFYKNYIATNKPCIILQAIDMQIVQKWPNPTQFNKLTKQLDPVSISITPDGFADSIKNQYFIQPCEIKGKISDIIDWKYSDKENKYIHDNWIPYIQHQNSNLTSEFEELIKNIDQGMKNFISTTYFQGNQPDASNFWMGYQNSVSSLHKDPYQNFYTTIVGEKHFTLLPPVSIVHLHQQTYKTAKYKINKDNSNLQAFTQKDSTYPTTRWISCNPDLQQDLQLFPGLNQIKQYEHHIVLQAGQTLYLPSLWYHQVSQKHQKDAYTIAINYWFDMGFNANYTLYESIRKIKGY